ncbi:MAG: citrate transporter [Lachnospiraceae bacterium]|nr:citrate transporter [Lachnospiraceae bacterium]
MNGVKKIFLKEPVTIISFLLAFLTVFIIPIDKEYINYIGYETLALLFTLMAITAGLRALGLFEKVGFSLLKRLSEIRLLSLVCVLLCFVSSMFVTNDVALITFVPFAIGVLNMADKKKYMIMVITLMTIAANLGSMITPIGNPHNLYLYELTEMHIGEFFMLMLPYTLFSLIALVIGVFIFVRKDKNSRKVTISDDITKEFKLGYKGIIYIGLFVLAVLGVLQVCPVWLVLLITFIVVFIMDRRTIFRVDYGLLLTFVFLFIFIGNIKRMDVVVTTLDKVVDGHEFILSVLLSQVLSDVPVALLLSAMSDTYNGLKEIIIGTNVGAVGTLIASMASLISFKLYSNTDQSTKWKYLLQFTIVNYVFLGLLTVFHYILNWM